MLNLKNIYKKRFNPTEIAIKKKLWKIICNNFLQKHIKEQDTVVDIAAGYCEFINNIKCKRKIANDLNPDIKKFSEPNVEISTNSASNLSSIPNETANIVFTSNFFEHLNSKQELLDVLSESNRILEPKGKIIILQPNIKYSYKMYWDFLDHSLALSHETIIEALNLTGFKTIKCIPKFLPFTTKTKASRFTFLLKIYLKLPILWKFFGKQMFVVGEKLS